MSKGLPRAQDNDRPQDAWSIMVLGGIERLTHSLRRGDAYTMKALNDMLTLQRRLQAFSDALTMRLEQAREPEVIEDENA